MMNWHSYRHPAARRRNDRTWLLLAGAMGLALAGAALAAPAPAAPEAPDIPAANSAVGTLTPPPSMDLLLDRTAWEEHTIGLSLRPPLGSQVLHKNMDETLVHILGEKAPDGVKAPYHISVMIREVPLPVPLERAVADSMYQLSKVQPATNIVESNSARLMGQVSSVNYYLIPGVKEHNNIIGQALIPVSLTSFAVVRLEVDEENFAAIRPVYEAVLFGMKIRDLKQTEMERRQAVARGEAWHRGLTAQTLARAAGGEQWYRWQDESGRDIGFMSIVQGRATQMSLSGVQVEATVRLQYGSSRIDSVSRFFLSDTLADEIWSVRNTSRPIAAGPATPAKPGADAQGAVQIWSDSGVRSGTKITVTRDGPQGPERLEWSMPDHGYLSQVEMYMLGATLPHDAAVEMGFYAYNPNLGKLAYRTDRVEPAGDGSYTIHSFPALDQPEQISRYDASGKMVERIMGDKSRLVLSTKAEVARIFQLPP